MRMEQLRCLVDVAQTKSMTKTAERLFISPQAVSKSIKQLEQELDTELLIRNSMGVTPTKIGEYVVERAKTMLGEEEKIGQMIAESKQQSNQENTFSIRICSTSAITNIVLPSILARYESRGIHIIPRITMVDSLQEVLDQVEQGESDIGLLTYNEEALFRKFVSYQHILDMDLLARDEQVVVMNAHAYQSGQKMVSMEDFHGHFCCMFCIMPVEEMRNDAISTHVMRSNDADFHRAMIKQANAYVLMPRLAYQHFFPGRSYVALPLEFERPPMLHAAVYRKGTREELRNFATLVRISMQ